MMGFHGSLTISIPSSDILVLTKAASRRIGNRLLNGRSFCDSATTTIYLIAHSIQCFKIRKKSTISGITSEDIYILVFFTKICRMEKLKKETEVQCRKKVQMTVDFRLLSLGTHALANTFLYCTIFTICEDYTHSHCELDSSKKCEHKRGITFSQTVRK